jgi:hypothetical protein
LAELNGLLQAFVDRLAAIIGAELVGVYLTGSFALGGGDEASDCDFLVVTDGEPSGDEAAALRLLHDEILEWPGYWAYNLEGSYAPRADVETLSALGRPWLYVDRGARELQPSPHCNSLDVRWVFVNRPFVVAGADPRTFACDVPSELLRASMRPQIAGFLAELETWASFDTSWTQRYAVEASSRMLYTLEQGAVISKQHALAWAAETMPGEWRELIEQVQQDRFVKWDEPARPGSVERARAYVAYVQARARE